MAKTLPKPIDGTLRKFSLRVPEVIRECSGIVVFGKRIKSLVFSTDVAIIRNVNADAVIAVYPFTPQPIITQAILSASDIPVLVGVGGGLTSSTRVLNLSTNAEMQGALGVVLNAPISNDIVKSVSESIDIPTVVTVVRDDEDIKARIEAGASILNVSAASRTPEIIRKIRKDFKDIPIIATGGPTEDSIRKTIEAGANAITWTPPSNGDIFRSVMDAYRNGQPHP
ncbi:MAG: hydrolase [Clostridiaceae bacterium]|nr:hydrolase [Clostridiaceae bacterium]MDD6703486.1 hydrolase [Clostridiaceae bacterium]MDY5934396.1 hydrolase [Oscillospiraceae bacterium]